MSSTRLSPAIGGYQGFIATEHQLPEGWKVVELKQCENCPAHFVREKHTGIKFCAQCCSRALLPVIMTEYRDMLPSVAEQHHSHMLPRYDDSLIDRDRVTRRGGTGYVNSWKENWRSLLAQVYVERGPLSVLEICEVVGAKLKNPSMAIRSLVQRRVGVELVASKYPRTVEKGRAHGLYSFRGLGQ